MTDTSPPPPATAAAPPPDSTPLARPSLVTAAGITLIVLGALTLLLGLILLIGAGLFAGAAGSLGEAAGAPEMGGVLGAFAGAVFVLTFVVIGFGVLQLLSGIKVLSGRSWARVTGLVVAIVAGVVALAGLGDAEGAILSLVLVVANGFVVFALATTGRWFAATPG